MEFEEQSIVLALAEQDPTYADDSLTLWCSLCDADLPPTGGPGDRPEPSAHDQNCPWRRATKYAREFYGDAK